MVSAFQVLLLTIQNLIYIHAQRIKTPKLNFVQSRDLTIKLVQLSTILFPNLQNIVELKQTDQELILFSNVHHVRIKALCIILILLAIKLHSYARNKVIATEPTAQIKSVRMPRSAHMTGKHVPMDCVKISVYI